MLSHYGLHGFIRKHIFIACMRGLPLFNHWMGSVNRVHTVHQLKHMKPIKQFNRKIERPIKSSCKIEGIDQKVYMRDIIGKILRILRYSTWDSAQAQLERLPIRWESYTINQVLKTHPPMEKAWLFFNWASRLKGFKHDQFTYTTMLDIFGEAGRISSMKYVFQQMEEKGIKIDAVTYTSILHWLSKDGDFDGSLKMWEEMKVKGCRPTVVSYTAFMKILFDNNRPTEATVIYKKMLESGCFPNCYTYTVLMEYLTGAGKFKAALEILNKMQEAGVQPDKATCNILVQKCCKAGDTWAMAQILQYMKEHSLVLRHPIYVEALETLKLAGESDDLLREVNPHLSCEEETPDPKVTAIDIHFAIDRSIVLNFLKKQNLIAVDHLLNGMINKNTQLDSALISTIIQVNCARHRPSGALLAFEYSVKMGINIERAAYLALIGLYTRTRTFPRIVEIIEEMLKARVSLGTYLVSLLIYSLGTAQELVSAAKIFNSLPDDQKNTATYTALMGTYFCTQNVEKGLEIYKTMRMKGVSVASGTYKMLIAGLETAGRHHEVEVYRKEWKNLLFDGRFREISMEERLCDLLFAGDVTFS